MAHKHQEKPNGNKTTSERPDQAQVREEIQQLAYRFYCECGYEHGHDLEHWAEAERRVLERHQERRSIAG